MYRDNSLLPSEAVRLLALGLLAEQPMRYGDLAREIRHFTGRIVGPSLDLVGVPLEVLKVEGLLEVDPASGDHQDAARGGEDGPLLRVSAAGSDELARLLSSSMRSPSNEMNKLIIALKMRLLHLLPAQEQRLQLEQLVEITEREVARLEDLRAHHDATPGLLPSWLDQEIGQARERLTWYGALLETR